MDNEKKLKKLKKYGFKIIYDYIDEFSNKICNTKKPYRIYKNLEKMEYQLFLRYLKFADNYKIAQPNIYFFLKDWHLHFSGKVLISYLAFFLDAFFHLLYQ